MFARLNEKAKPDPESPCKYEGRIFFESESGIMEAGLVCACKCQSIEI